MCKVHRNTDAHTPSLWAAVKKNDYHLLNSETGTSISLISAPHEGQ